MKLSQKALGWLGGGATGLLNGLFGSGGGMVAVPLLEHGGLEPAHGPIQENNPDCRRKLGSTHHQQLRDGRFGQD